jgi:hypothetical protein
MEPAMRLLWVLTAFFVLSGDLFASTRERLQEANFSNTRALEQASLERKNQSVLTYLWADVYAAAFYAPAQVSAAQAFSKPLNQRLELYYFRNIDSQDVIKAAWVTLERQHDSDTLARLRPGIDALHATFRDIRPGDRYALNFSTDNGLTLEVNEQQAFNTQDTELARAYLGIWLSPKGLSDKLRTSLLAD